jgi:hypothetical protein
MKNLILILTLSLIVTFSANAERDLQFRPSKILAVKVVNVNGPESLRIYGKDLGLASKVTLGNIRLNEIVEWNNDFIEVKLPNNIIPATYLLKVESKIKENRFERKWANMAITVGAVGPRGPQGYTGATGQTGPQGVQGLKGETGARGPKGEKGARGPKGSKGEMGASGVAPSELASILSRLDALEASSKKDEETAVETVETETERETTVQ